MKCYDTSAKEVARILETDLKFGLGERQSQSLLEKYGPNKIEEKKKPSMLYRFLMQFNDFMILILLVAAAVSFWVSFSNGESDFIDPIIILVIVVLNAILGLVQEYKAEKSLDALKKLSSPTAKVIRDGKLMHINSEELVPGDLIMVETGDFVPADARLVKSTSIKAEESALTGESVPVEKNAEYIASSDAAIGDRKNMIFSGSSISYGNGLAIVTHTGMLTEVGKIAKMIFEDESPETPLQKKLQETGKLLGIGALAICLFIFIIGILRKIEVFEMFMTSVSLAVAAIPEGLPAIVTIMLAIGVQRMAKRNSIIRKLPAVETLGSASVICSDKTGTLTQNKMTVVEVHSVNGTKEGKKELIKYSAMCNDTRLSDSSSDVFGDPTETALVLAALNHQENKNVLERDLPRVSEIPFDSERKLMTTIHKTPDGKYLSITKGAPDVLIKLCTFQNINQEKEFLKLNTQMADKALRVLGVAYRIHEKLPHKITSDYLERELTFSGLIGMMDPPREEAKEAVETCKRAGIKPVMITGDHGATAAAIAKKLGILEGSDKIMTGDELSRMSQDDLNKCIYEYSVFARVSPEHKVRIVKAFQSRGAVVSMTGDGVNDAPALKAADIGCAMGVGGTDVAKAAADMILTDDNFATIVHAVKEGRGIYANIKKSVHFLLSSNIGEIVTILSALLMGWGTPLLAIHLLWVNLVTDSLPAIALGLDSPDKDIMERKPFKGQKNLFDKWLWQRIGAEGIMIGLLSLIAFAYGNAFYNEVVGQTMAFATLSISQLVHAFNMRTDKSLFSINPFDNKYLLGAFGIGTLLQFSVIMIPQVATIFKVVPLTAAAWLVVLLLCIMPIVIVELQKASSGSPLVSKKKQITA